MSGLPVIQTCGDCSHNTLPWNAPGYSCDHGKDDNDNTYRAAPRDQPPPAWCPLRSQPSPAAPSLYTRSEVLAYGELVRKAAIENGPWLDAGPERDGADSVYEALSALDLTALLDGEQKGGERCSDLLMVNASAFVATMPADLMRAGSAAWGPENERALRIALGQADVIVAAWGATSRGVDVQRARAIMLFGEIVGGREVRCFGLTADGSPRHPSRLGNAVPLVPYAA